MARNTWADAFLANAEKFGRYNSRRIEYLRNYLPEPKRAVFDLLPVLLHEDSHELPGGDIGAPSGIPCFTYTPRLRDLLKARFPSFTPERKLKARFPVVFLALMGSAGSVAFTDESDFDLWVGVDEGRCEPGELELLRAKFRAIEHWTREECDLETHLFAADLGRVRQEDYGALSAESCGTAMGRLLKDEFYRTGVFLNGKIPYYWVMPPGTGDGEYRGNIGGLLSSPEFPHHNYVDLGNVARIDPAEYFGAALWQLVKGLSSPFKSVLKMALIDMYSDEGDQGRPLCERYKEMLRGAASTETADPYLFMIDAVREYYNGKALQSQRQLIEECFLIKNLISSGALRREDKARIEFFYRMGAKWGWPRDQLTHLTDYRRWDTAERENRRSRIMTYLVEAYSRVRVRTSTADMRISERDMTVAGKKLAGFFKQEPGKIPYDFSLVRARDVAAVELVEAAEKGKPDGWDVITKLVGLENSRFQMTRRLPSLAAACAWYSLNRYFRPGQTVRVRGRTPVVVKDAVALIASFSEFFPSEQGEALRVEDLLAPTRVTHLYALPNWDTPDWTFGIKSLVVFLRNTLGEMYCDQNPPGSDATLWLRDAVLLGRVGRANLRGLHWRIHDMRGQLGPARALRAQVADLIAGRRA